MDMCFSKHWPNGIVYYEVDRSYDDAERSVIMQAMAHISNHSCVRHVLAILVSNQCIQLITDLRREMDRMVTYKFGQGRVDVTRILVTYIKREKLAWRGPNVLRFM